MKLKNDETENDEKCKILGTSRTPQIPNPILHSLPGVTLHGMPFASWYRSRKQRRFLETVRLSSGSTLLSSATFLSFIDRPFSFHSLTRHSQGSHIALWISLLSTMGWASVVVRTRKAEKLSLMRPSRAFDCWYPPR